MTIWISFVSYSYHHFAIVQLKHNSLSKSLLFFFSFNHCVPLWNVWVLKINSSSYISWTFTTPLIKINLFPSHLKMLFFFSFSQIRVCSLNELRFPYIFEFFFVYVEQKIKSYCQKFFVAILHFRNLHSWITFLLNRIILSVAVVY